MTYIEFRQVLAELKLSQADTARLLSVDARTVRRWAEKASEIPGPVEQALQAWIRLQRYNLAWRPDSKALGENDAEIADQITRLRLHNIDLAAMLKEVEERGGPKHQVVVDLNTKTATSEKIEVGFYALPNGNFSPSTYRRLDQETDSRRDLRLLQDAYYCIAAAIAKAGKDWFRR